MMNNGVSCLVLETVYIFSLFGQLFLNNLKKGPALNVKLKFIIAVFIL